MQYKQSEGFGPFRRVAVAIALCLTSAACSSVPDWANPVEWYKGTANWISGDDEETAATRKAAQAPENAPPNADQPFPKLASVPGRPQGIDNRTQRREQVQNSLVADRSRARHAALNTNGTNSSPTQSVPGAPPRPTLTAPPTAPAPATGGGYLSPVQHGTMATPPPPRGRLTLTPPSGVATGGRQFATAASPRPIPGALGATARSQAVGTVLFANGSAKISEKYARMLQDIAKMQKEGGATVRVVGHASSRTRNTSPMGHQVANFRISLARAQAVADRLVRYGAARQRITVTGVADNEPIYQEIMPLGEAGNRRAEIYLDY